MVDRDDQGFPLDGWSVYSKLVLDKLHELTDSNKDMRRYFDLEIKDLKESLQELRVIMEGVRLRASLYGAIAGIGAGAGIILLRFLHVLMGDIPTL